MNRKPIQYLLAAVLAAPAVLPYSVIAADINGSIAQPAAKKTVKSPAFASVDYVVLESGSYTEYADMEFFNTTLYIKGTVVLEELTLRNVDLVGLDSNAKLIIIDEFENKGGNTVSNLDIMCRNGAAKEFKRISQAKAVTLYVYGEPTALGQSTDQVIHVKLDANGGTLAKGNQTRRSIIGVDGLAAISLPVPAKENALFLGWSTSKDDASSLIEGPVFTTDKDTTLYAIYNTSKVNGVINGAPHAVTATGSALNGKVNGKTTNGKNGSADTSTNGGNGTANGGANGNGTAVNGSADSAAKGTNTNGTAGNQAGTSGKTSANGSAANTNGTAGNGTGSNDKTNANTTDAEGPNKEAAGKEDHNGEGVPAPIGSEAETKGDGANMEGEVKKDIPVYTDGKWVENPDGSSSYQLPDGTYVKNTLAKIGKDTYYFNVQGKMAQNEFAVIDDKTYFFDDAGHMKTGWMKKPGTDDWYFFGEDGSMQTGWIKDKNSWYFLDENGELAMSEFVVDHGKTYYVDNAGARKTGWLNKNGNWYLFQDDGVMAVDTTLDGYTFDAKGICLNP